jgi:peroxiredoxin (alkyl hydroperoxide reductase subunit C)
MSEAVAGSIPKIGEKIPEFEAVSTRGPLKSSDLQGKWTVLFSHPADFTPVCTTELAAFAQNQDEFEKRGVQLVGLSIDSVHSHLAWLQNIEKNLGVEVKYPLIADLDMKVATKFGMIHPGASATATVRAVFIIDPQGVVRTLFYYPMNAGRNIDEILRTVDALQMSDANGVSAPVNWRPGEPVIVSAPKTTDEVKQRQSMEGVEKVDFYLVKKSL